MTKRGVETPFLIVLMANEMNPAFLTRAVKNRHRNNRNGGPAA